MPQQPTAPAIVIVAQPVAIGADTIQSTNDRESVSIALLHRIGNDAPTIPIIEAVVEWTYAEDHGNDAMARNNPWNTTLCTDAIVGSINRDGACGVAKYRTMEDGIDANARTLMQQNFAGIRAALLENDPDAFKQELWASGWASSHYGNGSAWSAPYHMQQQQVTPNVAPSSAITSNPLTVDGGDCGWNIKVALEANNGALQRVQLAPGETFSFNAAMGDPGRIDYRDCGGTPGGNWCNLAARYSQVARAMNLQPRFLHHNQDLGAGPENDVLIWNIGGIPGSENGRQDLEITNTTNAVIVFSARDVGGAVVIDGALQ